MMETKEKQLKFTQASANLINDKYRVSQGEIKELNNRLKGNMSLVEARQLISNDVIYEMKNIWEQLKLVAY